MNNAENLTKTHLALPLAYVRRVHSRDLPPQIEVPEGVTDLYAIHGEDGEPLALVGDRKMAFAVARQNDYTPVSVH
ncbi:DUF1150 family protein [Paroceanicella profunda]|uniref:DUF1150 family protein n=1 Tax=Paroceanicella profunda TaxID=2579971 RepID=A0A5B8G0X5_9RHOB|nr:DUF1150 family protein [Paroceanicella profunda]QDL93470.1 DUF1150 family protein [Paroceanicella profunda]